MKNFREYKNSASKLTRSFKFILLFFDKVQVNEPEALKSSSSPAFLRAATKDDKLGFDEASSTMFGVGAFTYSPLLPVIENAMAAIAMIVNLISSLTSRLLFYFIFS